MKFCVDYESGIQNTFFKKTYFMIWAYVVLFAVLFFTVQPVAPHPNMLSNTRTLSFVYLGRG